MLEKTVTGIETIHRRSIERRKKKRNGKEPEKAVKKKLIADDVVLSHTKCDALFEIIRKYSKED